jgi:hypothetical protein
MISFQPSPDQTLQRRRMSQESLVQILEQVWALFDDEQDASTMDEPIALGNADGSGPVTRELQEDRSLKVPWNGTLPVCTPSTGVTSSSSLFDLATILEPRPLAPYQCFQAFAPSFPVSKEVPCQVTSSSSSNCSASNTAITTPKSSMCHATGTKTTKRNAVNSGDTLLNETFTPGPFTVIIGRGREARNASGNRHLCKLAMTFLDEYATVPDKPSKSRIVATIARAIRDMCAEWGGSFVRLGSDGRWYEVSDAVATEKVGYTLRELSGERYRSSSSAKKIARQRSHSVATAVNLRRNV